MCVDNLSCVLIELTCDDRHRVCVSTVTVQFSRVIGADCKGVVFATHHVGEVTGGVHGEALSYVAVRVQSRGHVVSCVVGGSPGVQDDVTGALAVCIWVCRWAGCCVKKLKRRKDNFVIITVTNVSLVCSLLKNRLGQPIHFSMN